jgi:hypothetical protein
VNINPKAIRPGVFMNPSPPEWDARAALVVPEAVNVSLRKA